MKFIQILVKNLKKKKEPLPRIRCRWEDIRIDIGEVTCEHAIQLQLA
jgi:hypothetical protein